MVFIVFTQYTQLLRVTQGLVRPVLPWKCALLSPLGDAKVSAWALGRPVSPTYLSIQRF